MKWGIAFNVSSEFEAELYGLPPPSSKRYLTRMNKPYLIQVLYHFQYLPQGWREWQRVASIKIQMKKIGPHIEFVDYELIEGIERVYTVSELGKHFTAFVKFHKPFYPQGKDDFMRSLTIYAKRLYYEHKLSFEAVIAMAMHFSSNCKLGYSIRELNRKSRAIFELDMSEWKHKLSKEDLKLAYKERNSLIAKRKHERSHDIRLKAIRLRVEGKTL